MTSPNQTNSCTMESNDKTESNDNKDPKQLTLTQDQQRDLYAKLFECIGDLHNAQYKKDLAEFTQEYRRKKQKGVVLLHYSNTGEMVQAVTNKWFWYSWIPKNEVVKYNHSGINQAVAQMNPESDCVLSCSLEFSKKHLHMNCYRIKNVESQ